MLYQLSYSPNELGNLAPFFEGYTSAVRTKRTCTLNAQTWQEDSGKKPVELHGRVRARLLEEARASASSGGPDYPRILVTTPAPTVLPPSRIANRSPSSHAIGVTSSTSTFTLSPGITISTPGCSVTFPVTSVVRK